MNFEYAIQIGWSTEDSAYIAIVHDLPGCMSDGKTPEEALQNARQVIQEWLEVAKEEKRGIPPPLSVQDIGRALRVAEENRIRSEIERGLNEVKAQLIDNAVRRLEEQSSSASPWAQSGTSYDELDLAAG
jgi:predicted RNase H-like HicB family nuclease